MQSTLTYLKSKMSGAVRAILGDKGAVPHIIFSGTSFRSVDQYPVVSMGKMLAQGKSDPNEIHTLLCASPNARPLISLPDPNVLKDVSEKTLLGGAYHEALHVRLSRTNVPSLSDITSLMNVRRRKVIENPQTRSLIPSAFNILEDIRIERYGCGEFQITQKMEALQDQILAMEDPSRMPLVNQALCCVRDLGLGYQTSAQLIRYSQYDQGIYKTAESGRLSRYWKAVSQQPSKISPLMVMGLAIDLVSNLDPQLFEGLPESTEQDPISQFLQDLLCEVGSECSPQSTADEGVRIPVSGGSKNFERSDLFDEAIKLLGKINKNPSPMSQSPIESWNEKKDLLSFRTRLTPQTSALTAKIRRKFLTDRQTQVGHGFRHGYDLSEQRVVEEYLSIQSGAGMDRPFSRKVVTQEEGMRAVVLLDRSSSTSHYKVRDGLEDSAYILVQSLTACHTYVAAMSFGGYFYVAGGFTRNANELLAKLLDTPIGGGTPMAEAVGIAINELAPHTERHRFIFVVTDGDPDNSDRLNEQIARAQRLGIQCVGIGITEAASYVQSTFEESVYSPNLADMPHLTGRKIEQLCGRKRI